MAVEALREEDLPKDGRDRLPGGGSADDEWEYVYEDELEPGDEWEYVDDVSGPSEDALEDGDEWEYVYEDELEPGDEWEYVDEAEGAAAAGKAGKKKQSKTYKQVQGLTDDMNSLYRDGVQIAAEFKGVFDDIKESMDFTRDFKPSKRSK